MSHSPVKASRSIRPFLEDPPVVNRRRISNKVSFIVYIFFLLTCIGYAGVLIVWGVLIKFYSDLISGFIEGFASLTPLKTILNDLNTDLQDVSCVFLIILGLLLEIVLFAGLYSSTKTSDESNSFSNNETTISMFHVISLRIYLAIIFLLTATCLALDSPLRNDMSSAMETSRYEKDTRNASNTTAQNSMDIYQIIFHCCGSRNVSDWIDSSNIDDYTKWIPPASCCEVDRNCLSTQTSFIDGLQTTSSAMVNESTPSSVISSSASVPNGKSELLENIYTAGVYTSGCDRAIHSWLYGHALLLLLTGVLLSLLCISWCIWRKFTDRSQLCCLRCNQFRRTTVKPFNQEDGNSKGNSVASSEDSLIFLQQCDSVKSINSQDDIATSSEYQALNSDMMGDEGGFINNPGHVDDSDMEISHIKKISQKRKQNDRLIHKTDNRHEAKIDPKSGKHNKYRRTKSRSAEELSKTNLFHEKQEYDPELHWEQLDRDRSGRLNTSTDQNIDQFVQQHPNNSEASTSQRGNIKITNKIFSNPKSPEKHSITHRTQKPGDVWATSVLQEPESSQPDGDELSLYSLDSIEW